MNHDGDPNQDVGIGHVEVWICRDWGAACVPFTFGVWYNHPLKSDRPCPARVENVDVPTYATRSISYPCLGVYYLLCALRNR